MYETMLKIKGFESKAADCFTKGMMYGNIHLCLGQEAVPTGACAALEPDDYMASTHRGHGHCVAKGGDLKINTDDVVMVLKYLNGEIAEL